MYTCDLYIWTDDIIPGVTTMIEVTPAIDRIMDGRENQVCSKCENIDGVMKAFESNEIAKSLLYTFALFFLKVHVAYLMLFLMYTQNMIEFIIGK